MSASLHIVSSTGVSLYSQEGEQLGYTRSSTIHDFARKGLNLYLSRGMINHITPSSSMARMYPGLTSWWRPKTSTDQSCVFEWRKSSDYSTRLGHYGLVILPVPVTQLLLGKYKAFRTSMDDAFKDVSRSSWCAVEIVDWSHDDVASRS